MSSKPQIQRGRGHVTIGEQTFAVTAYKRVGREPTICHACARSSFGRCRDHRIAEARIRASADPVST